MVSYRYFRSLQEREEKAEKEVKSEPARTKELHRADQQRPVYRYALTLFAQFFQRTLTRSSLSEESTGSLRTASLQITE